MTLKTKTIGCIASVLAMILLTAAAHGDFLYVSDQFGNLSTFNTANNATAFVGNEPNFPLSTEIEYGLGQLFSEETNGNTFLHTINPANGQSTGFVMHGPAAFNGMEFVGNTLYVTNVMGGGGGSPSTLEIVNPLTGAQVVVGPTGVNNISGLAYETSTNTMFGVTGGGGVGNLGTLNLGNGLFTPGPVLFDSVSGAAITHVGSIEFHNGVLYGGTSQNSNINPGWIFSINPLTGASTFLGPSGLNGVTGITVIPEPASAALCGLAILGVLLKRRKRI